MPRPIKPRTQEQWREEQRRLERMAKAVELDETKDDESKLALISDIRRVQASVESYAFAPPASAAACDGFDPKD